MPSHHIVRIVSGGQSGADRAALDAAIEAGIEYGGWCPAGGWAEDYPEPPGLLADYPKLREADSPDPDVRTQFNVRDSDATLIFRAAPSASPGTDLTSRTAESLARPYLVTDGSITEIRSWIAALPKHLTLNVAGPRESEQRGLYDATLAALRQLLSTDSLDQADGSQREGPRTR